MHINDIYNPIRSKRRVNPSLAYLKRFLKRESQTEDDTFKVDLSPDFQRDHVWTLGQRMDYVGFVLEGGPLSPITVNEKDYEDTGVMTLVDGKQRLTSLLKWLDDDIRARLTGGDQVYRRHVEGSLRSIFLEIDLVSLDREGMLEYYIKRNRGGTVHTDEEIEKVRRLLIEERRKQ